MMNAQEMREAFTALFEKINLNRNQDALERFVDTLVMIGQTPGLPEKRQEVVRRSLRRAGRTQSIRELEELAAAAEKFVKAVEALHAPAMHALAWADVRNINNEPFLQADRGLAEKARAARAFLDETVGIERPQDLRPKVIAGLVVKAYGELYGGRPDLPNQSPGLEKLLAEVFAILGIRASAKAALRAAEVMQRATASRRIMQ
jgi:hypothetical protein